MKLKSIPHTIIVHTPTEAEAKELLSILHENGWKWKTGEVLHNLTNWDRTGTTTCYKLYEYNKCLTYGYKSWFLNNNEIIITLSEFKELYCGEDKPQPQFKVDDKVAIRWINKIGTITNVRYSEEAEEWEYDIKVSPTGLATALEHNITLYTELEAKMPKPKFSVGDPVIITADGHEKGMTGTITYYNPVSGLYTIDQLYIFNECDLSLAPKPETTEDMEAKELNLVELLKGYEEEIFYHLMYGEVRYKGIDKYGFIAFTDSEIPAIYDDGKYDQDANVVLFPSRALYEQYPLDPYTAWMKWQQEQKKHTLDVNLRTFDAPDTGVLLKFRTTADRDKCIEEIKAIIEKYSK